MLILALETTADVCSLAIRDDKGLMVERAFRHRMHLSERLIGDVDDLLKDAGLSLSDVEGFGVGIGPGSFTGVRIGVTTVKTWAVLFGKPVVGVTSLGALAEEYVACAGSTIAPIVRARPGSVYSAFYTSSGTGVAPADAIGLCSIDVLIERLKALSTDRVIVCGEALDRYGGQLRDTLPECVTSGRPDAPRAAVVAEIAQRRIAAGAADDPLALVPCYVSPPPIDPAVELRTRQALRS